MNQKNKKPKNRNRIYFGVIIFYFFLAIFASLLANEKPLYFSINGKKFFPAFNNDPYTNLPDENGIIQKIRTNNIDWKNLKADRILFAPVCWSPSHSDLLNTYASPFARQQYYHSEKLIDLPFRFRHFLGTGKTGNDVLAGLIHGSRTSISIGFFSMSIALVLGVFLGGIAGYSGDDKIKLSRGSILLSFIMLIPSWFYSFQMRSEILRESFSTSLMTGIFQLVLSLIIFLIFLSWPFLFHFNNSSFLRKKINIPVDTILSRFIEIFLSLPKPILIITLAAISRPTLLTIILIIGLTSWTDIARMMRAQVLQLREMNFIAATKAFGTGTITIIFRHLLPNALSQIFVIWTIGIATAILTETSLSFLGVGVPPDVPTWGSLMYEAKENYQAWWLVVFSGVAVFTLLSSLYLIGNKMKSMDKLSRSSINKFLTQ